MIEPLHSTVHALYDAARTAVVAFDRRDRGRLAVTGRDRATFLHALFTNDITALKAGHGCYTAYLTPQGRMISDFVVRELGDRMWLELDRSLASGMAARLDQLIFTEDVQVTDVSGEWTGAALVGPEAVAVTSALVQGVTLDDLRGVPELGSIEGTFQGRPAVVLRIDDLGTPGYELVVELPSRMRLDEALAERGVARGVDALAEILRIEGGVPKFLSDMTAETIPLEAGIESRAISTTKGCYVGQEVIVRVLHRGHGRVAEKLVVLEIDGQVIPSPGTEVHAAARSIGRVTSSTMSPALGHPIALAYLHRDFVAPGTEVKVGNSEARVRTAPVQSIKSGPGNRPGT